MPTVPTVPTVRIHDGKGDYRLVNESDFDPKTMKKWKPPAKKAETAPAPAPAEGKAPDPAPTEAAITKGRGKHGLFDR
jgi:hypothetical protein